MNVDNQSNDQSGLSIIVLESLVKNAREQVVSLEKLLNEARNADKLRITGKYNAFYDSEFTHCYKDKTINFGDEYHGTIYRWFTKASTERHLNDLKDLFKSNPKQHRRYLKQIHSDIKVMMANCIDDSEKERLRNIMKTLIVPFNVVSHFLDNIWRGDIVREDLHVQLKLLFPKIGEDLFEMYESDYEDQFRTILEKLVLNSCPYVKAL